MLLCYRPVGTGPYHPKAAHAVDGAITQRPSSQWQRNGHEMSNLSTKRSTFGYVPCTEESREKTPGRLMTVERPKGSMKPKLNDWSLVYEGYRPEQEGLREALCTLGNGYFATRGAPPTQRPTTSTIRAPISPAATTGW
jgi:hypothetical protein